MTESRENSDAANPQTIPQVPAKRKGLLRRLYNWVLHWAETPYGTPALFVIAFAESSFFPIPPDVLQIALSAGKPKRSFYYAAVTLTGSVSGAVFGYFIGYCVWEVVRDFFFHRVIDERLFERVQGMYAENVFWAIFAAAVTPIPYKIFTIAAGVCQISLLMLLFASVAGRGLRFFAVASLLRFFGPSIKTWIERYFEMVSILFLILLAGGFAVIKWVL
ncbi:MAG: DedA family protein [Planctomycetaceae bacterium]|jgi:membrane protein YqaA with SNARE-associated domain|nr:DedA family protein [Planctomycetaceae bacterium]